jgi:predicted nucleotidyltransferase
MFKELNIMRLFFDEPSREFGVREAAKLLDVAPATASKDLSELAENGFLKVREDRRMILYSANIDSDQYRDLKVFYTIRMLKEKGFIDALNKFYTKPSIILFGNCAQGTDKELSDLGIVVIADKADIFAEKENYEKIFGRKIQLIVVHSIPELGSKELMQSVVNGKILQGELGILT